jgi:hypothetical protein
MTSRSGFTGTPDEVVAKVVGEVSAHVIPNSFIVPAMVGEISRLGLKGYPLVYVPKAF